MKVGDCMTREVVTVNKEDPIRKVWEIFDDKSLRRLPVMEDGRLVGIITDRDLRNATASSVVLTEKKYHDYLLNTVKVESIMTPNPETVDPEAALQDAARVILDMKVGGLPVIESGRLVGIVTETDLIEALIDMLG